MQKLEEQALGEESKSHHNFLSACQAALYHTLQPLRENLATSYQVLLGQSSPSSPSVLPTKASLQGRAAMGGCPSHSNAQMVSKTKKATSFARATGEHIYRRDYTKGYVGRTPQSQEARGPCLVHITQT